MSKPAELRDRATSSSTCSLKETEKNLFRLRLQRATERLEAPSEIIKAKREIARIKTILRRGNWRAGELPADQLATRSGRRGEGRPCPASGLGRRQPTVRRSTRHDPDQDRPKGTQVTADTTTSPPRPAARRRQRSGDRHVATR